MENNFLWQRNPSGVGHLTQRLRLNFRKKWEVLNFLEVEIFLETYISLWQSNFHSKSIQSQYSDKPN